MDDSVEVGIGLDDGQRRGVVAILNRTLADEIVLEMMARKAHWNVTGPDFEELHEQFEEQYTELAAIIDEVAERARSLGGWALGTLAELSTHARLGEDPGEYPHARGHVQALLDAHEGLIGHLRQDLVKCDEEFGDLGTNDFLTGLLQRHEKMAWMLRATLRTA